MTDNDPFDDCARSILEFIRASPCGATAEGFEDIALCLFRLQWNQVANYRRWALDQGHDPATVSKWEDIPAVPTSGFKVFDLSSLSVEGRSRVFHSSGTTGQAFSRHFHDAGSLKIYEASLLKTFSTSMLREDELAQAGAGRLPLKLICLSPMAQAAPHSSLVHMFEFVGKQMPWARISFRATAGPDGAWDLNAPGLVDDLREAVRSRTPVVILGTAFMFVHAMDELAGRGMTIELPPGSRVMETGGYKGRSRSLPKEELHALIEMHLGVPQSRILCEYGMSELGSQAYDGLGGIVPRGPRRLTFPPWTRIQILSPETGRPSAEGEAGLLRIFDLANVRSVLAIQTEDLAIRHGDSFYLLGRAEFAESRGCSLMAS